ncbi:hypothetical protein LY10_02234 [Planktotalea frisia]|jgi:hypothetical protein|uniref:DUF2157 domain-containing protein n=1 Tax=Planktotalea frisia TaxID=696762 RepID=A0A1L9NWM4_9RHOB|nr:hypothetical protein [Planktotalea frisia]OJI93583.1 hypothetical protein PFRI_22120 [Planktotalea frisia]PZX28255.1 hypothetical protein LY10_02234 [Planktotalea frisia]
MSLDKDDIRAAVASNILTEPQAASLMALADRRRGTRENMDGLDEPFELFRGFNEVFIVIGLVILYSGWMGLTGISLLLSDNENGSTLVYGVISVIVTYVLTRYFTVKRRMVAPSIMLVVLMMLSGLQIGASLANLMGFSGASMLACAVTLSTLLLAAYYFMFRIPVTVFFIALGVFVATGALVVQGGVNTPSPSDFFMLTNNGPYAYITIILGLIGLAIALRFDMSDPHRVTRRASSGFWLHVIAAPAIVNTVALTLLEGGGIASQIILLGFLAMMAVFAMIIDRRSFLVAGIGYIVALAITILDGNAAIVILILGLGLVFLGAKWEGLRARIMDALPGFPGKEELPPWGLTETSL